MQKQEMYFLHDRAAYCSWPVFSPAIYQAFLGAGALGKDSQEKVPAGNHNAGILCQKLTSPVLLLCKGANLFFPLAATYHANHHEYYSA